MVYSELAIRPSELPRMRRQLAAHLSNLDSNIRSKTSADMQPPLDRLAGHAKAADLYWVAPDMAALAVHAGGDLAAARWTVADRPSACGLLWWGDGVHHIAISPHVNVPIDALTWGPAPEGTEVWTYVHRRRVENATTSVGKLAVEAVPPLVPLSCVTVPAADDPVPVAALPEQAGAAADGVPPAALMTLAAAWLLMDQPTLAEQTSERVRGAEARSSARADLPPPVVTAVDLRRQFVPDMRDAGQQGRGYRHRWVVSGYWRQQPYGPGREQRRQQWIPSHVKGPDGAPLLTTERVNVWRR